jgi:hypothetical protein
MGICASKYSKIYELKPELRKNMMAFDSLGISEADLGQFYRSFLKWDEADKGVAEILEILMTCNETSKFAIKVFRRQHSRTTTNADIVTFPEFVISIWEFCSLSKYMLGMLYLFIIMYHVKLIN